LTSKTAWPANTKEEETVKLLNNYFGSVFTRENEDPPTLATAAR